MQPKLCDCDRGTRIAFRVVVARFDGTILDTTALCATCLLYAPGTPVLLTEPAGSALPLVVS